LQNQPNDEVNNSKISDFRNKIGNLKRNSPNSSSLAYIQGVSQKATPSNLIGIFCLGFGICMIIVLIFYFVKKALSLQS
jgi:hypothetical protein